MTGVPAAAKSLIPNFDFIPSTLGGIPTSSPALEWSGKERVNVLLLGVDTRPDERGQPTRTDTIMIASVDPVNKTGSLLSIPRDLWVPIPLDPRRPLEDKITTAHFYGDYFQYEGGGPALADLDLPGDRYGDAVLPHLAAVPTLKTLRLRDTRVSDAGVPVLSRLTGLRGLDLTGSRVTPEGLKRLRAALPNCTVRSESAATDH